LATIAIVVAWLGFCGLAAGAERPPNIVLILADDMGYGDLGCQGHPLIATPRLDRMADEGIRLSSFYSAPSCVPARVQLLLGIYPSRVELGGTGSGGSGGIPDDRLTLPQALKAAGYRTGMVGKWHLGYQQDKYLPVGKGFDYWYGLPYSNDMQPPWVKTDVPLWLYENTERVEHPVDQSTLTTRYTEHAVEFIRESKDAPFFLYLAHAMPHLPIDTRADFRGKSAAGLYGDVIETIDWSAGQILDTLAELGLDENTIVVFTSDNGPWLNLPERMLAGGVEPWHAGSPGHLAGAKHTILEGGPRVPCIVRWPSRVPGGRVANGMAATMDLYTTLITAAGGALPAECDGHDLLPLLTGQTEDSPREAFFYHRGSNAPKAVRVGPWKLNLEDGATLHHLELDPSERFDRAEEFPELVAELRKKLEDFENQLGKD
jgi:arylsulfatase A-like enzyme